MTTETLDTKQFKDLTGGQFFKIGPTLYLKLSNAIQAAPHLNITAIRVDSGSPYSINASDEVQPVDHDKYRLALLNIGAEHPAWSADPNDLLVILFNRVTADAREAVGAVGSDDDEKADWCADEGDRMQGIEPETDNDD